LTQVVSSRVRPQAAWGSPCGHRPGRWVPRPEHRPRLADFRRVHAQRAFGLRSPLAVRRRGSSSRKPPSSIRGRLGRSVGRRRTRFALSTIA